MYFKYVFQKLMISQWFGRNAGSLSPVRVTTICTDGLLLKFYGMSVIYIFIIMSL